MGTEKRRVLAYIVLWLPRKLEVWRKKTGATPGGGESRRECVGWLGRWKAAVERALQWGRKAPGRFPARPSEAWACRWERAACSSPAGAAGHRWTYGWCRPQPRWWTARPRIPAWAGADRTTGDRTRLDGWSHVSVMARQDRSKPGSGCTPPTPAAPASLIATSEFPLRGREGWGRS